MFTTSERKSFLADAFALGYCPISQITLSQVYTDVFIEEDVNLGTERSEIKQNYDDKTLKTGHNIPY